MAVPGMKRSMDVANGGSSALVVSKKQRTGENEDAATSNALIPAVCVAGRSHPLRTAHSHAKALAHLALSNVYTHQAHLPLNTASATNKHL